ncbi:amidohydrolase family protein [Noviherbaspirillum cavernae]|uniref:Amidohydrolase family protein n=1 Tax=Noviherbaspirillum cavernae TaxID=2320862 RepID=A0A418WZU1_9BURK|nr:amidohydrolase family protein [Noviherbaspirillum cavernae]RJG05722.1 amidohydrolase family protein [Noviherbaspirillum cavernae]
MNNSLRRTIYRLALTCALAASGAATTAAAQSTQPSAPAKPVTLITNARIFDGRSDALTAPMSVLVDGNVIARIAPRIDAPAGATVIDAGGRTMTPGFIDAHYHMTLQLSPLLAIGSDEYYHAFNAVPMARSTLARGFTTVRDVSGNTFSLKRAIDRGLIVGPRIYPSGPMISQTSGHADARMASERSPAQGGRYSPLMELGYNAVADGVPEVLKATRENLRRGASQIKIAVGGGTGSESDPLDVSEFTSEEIRAAVQAAGDWNTYVTAHVYTINGIRRAIDNGVKCIEHGQLMDEATMRLMKDKGIWWSPQVSIFTFIPKGYTADQKRKHEQAFSGLDAAFRTAKKIGFDRIAFGTDIVTDPDAFNAANEEFVHRLKWFTPAEILRQATYTNAQLLAMSGPRNPFPGKLGVIAEGAIADLLLINGNPLQDISILIDYRKNIALIMKDGVIYKDLIGDNEVNLGL